MPRGDYIIHTLMSVIKGNNEHKNEIILYENSL